MPFRAATITRPAAAACWSTSRRANRPHIPHIVRASADPLNDGAYCDLPLYAEAPDMDKRRLMNALVLGAVALPTAQATYTYLSVLMPAKEGGAGDAVAAKDQLGNPVLEKAWLAGHPPGDRSLVQGLQGDATYLIVTDNGGLEHYAVNSICTHLGCVVPWNAAENKFMCPCHGSEYDARGKKTRGPAPLSLALAHTEVADSGVVMLSPWKEEDFRDGSQPWWA